jgi:hypothetical protein
MNKFLMSALLLAPGTVLAASNFDGTWKARPDSIKVSGKPDVFVIAGGSYSCASCDPAIDKLPADGAWHKVSGHSYYDEISVRIVDASTVEVSTRKNGKNNVVDTMHVAADGKSYTGKFTNYNGAQPVTGSYTEQRVAAAPAGSHALSGSWLQEQVNLSDSGLTVAFAMTPEQFSMKANGQSYEAKFDGKQYPVAGDPGKTMVTLKKVDANTVDETDYRQGKIVDEIRMATADGKSLQYTDKDVAHGQTTTMTMEKQ